MQKNSTLNAWPHTLLHMDKVQHEPLPACGTFIAHITHCILLRVTVDF